MDVRAMDATFARGFHVLFLVGRSNDGVCIDCLLLYLDLYTQGQKHRRTVPAVYS